MNLSKDILLFALLSCIGLSANAQRSKKSDKPATYRIEATQKINADIYQLTYNTKNGNIYVVGPKGDFKSQNEKVEYPDKQYVYVLDGNTLVLKDSIQITSNFAGLGIAINNKTQTLYVGHSFNQCITAIDLQTKQQTLIPSNKKESKIRELVIDEVNDKVYVSDHGNPSIWVIDGKTKTYQGEISVPGAFIIGLNIDAKRNRIYATDGSKPEQYILAYDTENHKQVGKWKTWGSNSLNIAIDYQKNRLFISENSDNKLCILNGDTGEIITKVSLSTFGGESGPVGIVYDERKDLVYVAQRNGREIAVVDAKEYKIIERIPTQGLSNTVVLDKNSGAVFVTNKAPHSWGDKPAELLENGNTVQKIVKIN